MSKPKPTGCISRLHHMIRAFRGVVPKIAASCYIDQSAQVIGDVEVGERSSIWCNVSIRGDVNYIRIGEETSIQDNTVIHVEHDVGRLLNDGFPPEPSHGGPAHGFPTVIGNRVTVGHSATLHGCTIEDECLIGIGSIVLNGARIGRGSIVAAGALVAEGMDVPPGSVVMGVPGKIRRQVTPEEQKRFAENAQHYVIYRKIFREEPS
jgi:carbonic anhydrase/acetyltransferase-like protein (isoleucine patch superfamily)